MDGFEHTTYDQGPQPLAVTDRARTHLAHVHRRAEVPPEMAIAIQPGDDGQPRITAKRPDATDRVVAVDAEGAPLLVVPARAAEALAGAVLDFVEAPEPGFVVRR